MTESGAEEMRVKPIFEENGRVSLIDQTKLPGAEVLVEITTVQRMWEAIRRLEVRGAPAIGLAAAFGVWLAVRGTGFPDHASFVKAVEEAGAYLNTSRPTAVNLSWATARMLRAARSPSCTADALLEEARRMLREDAAACRAIGEQGAPLLGICSTVLTHCNAGALATSEYGTALAPIYVLAERGRRLHVYSDETRPLLQGSRLTAWELARAGISVTTICDNMAGSLMGKGEIDAVIVGADRIAANGDFANKIGTYSLAVLAQYHGIPFYTAAPFSTVDFAIKSGTEIPIEERDGDEVRCLGGVYTAPRDVPVYNPAFDVTRHELVTAIITERGVASPPFDQTLRALWERP